MVLASLLAKIKDWAPVEEIRDNFNRGEQVVYGLGGSARRVVMAGLLQECHQSLIVVENIAEARRLVEELTALLPQRNVLLFPAYELLPYEVKATSLEPTSRRLRVLSDLLQGREALVVAPAEALVKRLMPPAELRRSCLLLKTGMVLEPAGLAAELVRMGYERVGLVDSPGHFAIRGGIIDIYPLVEPLPVRLELFGDELDSIRTFEPVNQKTITALEKFWLSPNRELLYDQATLEAGVQRIGTSLHKVATRLEKKGQGEAAGRLREKVAGFLERLREAGAGPEAEAWQVFFYPEQATLLEYLARQAPVFVDEPQRVREVMQANDQARHENFAYLLEQGAVLPEQALVFADYTTLQESWNKRRTIYFPLLPKQIAGIRPVNQVSLATRGIQRFQGNLKLLAEEARRWRRQGKCVLLLCGNAERAARLKQILADYEVEANLALTPAYPLTKGQVLIGEGALHNGFELDQLQLVVVAEADFRSSEARPRPRPVAKRESRFAAFTDLKINDYVVHVSHGIGRYLGIEKLEVSGIIRDYLVIQYVGEDRLYVPADQLEVLQKYIGAEGHVPRLSRLGGSEWAKTKSKAQASVKEMAEELLKLYATRQAETGFAYGEDTVWQKEFEEAFPYEETADQLRAITDVKRDLMSPRPMDRLLCGDVGYGKTEVAIRAAFKAVQDSMQVAFLVPTTILAQQHYTNFLERFAGYPVQIDVLSRFRSAKEQRETIKALKNGVVDIIIGTHRLLSGDVTYKDLGLLIIDEEQRFGVAHKEKIKLLKHNIDVLTLTATPIPRTLHMSMVGARDMSLIETPPEERYPVQTYVVEFSPELIREAIIRELDRGGQVFYVHNRVETIEKITGFIRTMVPAARVAVAHGQMREEELERVMLDFLAGRYDILVCTTIIESGLDIANVNTLIVDQSDTLGLAQLYQLRGRVGRSNRVAYAYFTFRKDKVLSEIAEKRLYAIREFTELGSGFKIALRDLEIRGAGNILGPEQHGHILAIGFDLYCRMLEDAVRELKDGEPAKPVLETTIDLPVDVHLADEYIGDPALKIDLYKRVLAIRAVEEAGELEEEIRDRFGPLPSEVGNLMALARLKALARQIGVGSIEYRHGEAQIRFARDPGLGGEDLLRLAKPYRRRLTFAADQGLEIRLKIMETGYALLSQITKLVQDIVNMPK